MNRVRMDIPLSTEADYRLALEEFASLIDAPEESRELERLDVLATLIEQYEEDHYPIDPPDPIEAIKFRMEQAQLSEEDLIPCIGSLTMVKEVLAGRQPLTIDMAKDLETSFGMLIEDLLHKGEGR